MAGTDVAAGTDQIGERVRSRRLEAGLSVAELARRCDVSAPFISQVEAGRSNLSLATLYRVASVLDCTPNVLLGSVPARTHVTRAGDGPRLSASSGRQPQKPRLLTNTGKGVLLEAYHYAISPGDDAQDWFEHEGEDFLYVIKGSVAVLFEDGTEFVLGAGDSLHHEGAVPHRWERRGRGTAEVVLTVANPRSI